MQPNEQMILILNKNNEYVHTFSIISAETSIICQAERLLGNENSFVTLYFPNFILSVETVEKGQKLLISYLYMQMLYAQNHCCEYVMMPTF